MIIIINYIPAEFGKHFVCTMAHLLFYNFLTLRIAYLCKNITKLSDY